MKHNKIKTLILAGLITACAIFPAFARNRVWVTGYEPHNNFTIFNYGTPYTYYLNYDSNGAYVPYNPETMTGADIVPAMVNGFPQYQAWSGEVGGRMANSAFQVGGLSGLPSVMVKYICDQSALHGESSGVSLVGGRTNIGLSTGQGVEFRYAGLTIDYDGRGTLIENSAFPGDVLAKGTQNSFTYKALNGEEKSASYNGKQEYNPKAPTMDRIGVTGNATVTAAQNTIYNDNEEKAQLTFETWANTTAKGAEEKAKIIQALMPLPENQGDGEWWKTANKYIEIDGDIINSESAVVLYATSWDEAKAANESPCQTYRSWVIPKNAKKNVAVTAIIIRDDNGTELGRSTRSQSGPNSVGYDEQSVATVGLVPGQIYSVEIQQTYMANDGSTSVTSNKGAPFVYKELEDAITRTANATRMQMQPISHTQGGGQGTVIGPGNISSGPIAPDDGSTTMAGESYDTGIGYLYTDSYIIDGNHSEEAIVMVVDHEFTENGDNQIFSDDTLMIIVVPGAGTTSPGCPPEDPDCHPIPTENDHSDLNLGNQELRRLHWKEEVEIEPEDDGDDGGGEGGEGGGEPPEPVYEDHEFCEGEDIGMWDESNYLSQWYKKYDDPRDSAFWEYYAWPSSAEDAPHKLWIEQYGGTKYDDQYERNTEFNICYRITHSRGTNIVAVPTVSSKVYTSDNTFDLGDQDYTYSGEYKASKGIGDYSSIDVSHPMTTDEPWVNVHARVAEKLVKLLENLYNSCYSEHSRN